jgi:hypothetical protein
LLEEVFALKIDLPDGDETYFSTELGVGFYKGTVTGFMLSLFSVNLFPISLFYSLFYKIFFFFDKSSYLFITYLFFYSSITIFYSCLFGDIGSGSTLISFLLVILVL